MKTCNRCLVVKFAEMWADAIESNISNGRYDVSAVTDGLRSTIAELTTAATEYLSHEQFEHFNLIAMSMGSKVSNPI